MGWFSKKEEITISTAEAFIEEQSCLYRHYAIEEVTDSIARHTGVSLNDEQTAAIVQGIRDRCGMGPIDEWNMPGFVDPDDYPEDQEARRAQIAERNRR
ncbi:MAG TPA: hypothetical protein VF458_20350 [Ktedonobacteraceae bacterium]